MTIITRAEFARRAGMARASVTAAVSHRRLPSVDGNIDLDDPKVQEFLRKKARMIPAAGVNGTGRPIDIGRPAAAPTVAPDLPPPPPIPALVDPPAPPDADAGDSQLDAVTRNRKWQAELTRSKAQRSDFQHRQDIGESLQFAQAARSFSIFTTALDEQLRNFDQRLAAELVAAVSAGGGQVEVAALIRRGIDASVKTVVLATRRALRDMKVNAQRPEVEAVATEVPTAAAPPT